LEWATLRKRIGYDKQLNLFIESHSSAKRSLSLRRKPDDRIGIPCLVVRQLSERIRRGLQATTSETIISTCNINCHLSLLSIQNNFSLFYSRTMVPVETESVCVENCNHKPNQTKKKLKSNFSSSRDYQQEMQSGKGAQASTMV
jgi:hypothetical protein